MFTSFVVGLGLAIPVKAKLTDVTGNNLFLLWWNGDSKRVVNDCFLHGVHCVKIWKEPHGRATVHWKRHERFDVQRRLHHQGGCAHEGRKGSGVACAACQEQKRTNSINLSHPLPSQAPSASTRLLSCDLQTQESQKQAPGKYSQQDLFMD